MIVYIVSIWIILFSFSYGSGGRIESIDVKQVNNWQRLKKLNFGSLLNWLIKEECMKYGREKVNVVNIGTLTVLFHTEQVGFSSNVKKGRDHIDDIRKVRICEFHMCR